LRGPDVLLRGLGAAGCALHQAFAVCESHLVALSLRSCSLAVRHLSTPVREGDGVQCLQLQVGVKAVDTGGVDRQLPAWRGVQRVFAYAASASEGKVDDEFGVALTVVSESFPRTSLGPDDAAFACVSRASWIAAITCGRRC
jgi:hypothetical protein